jgi:hypothetical protein
LFIRTHGNGNTHGKGADVLKKFIDKGKEDALTSEEKKKLRRVFTFLDKAYDGDLGKTELASDYSHFYIMVTSLLSGDLLPKRADDADHATLEQKLIRFRQTVGYKQEPLADGKKNDMEEYIGLSARQTTDVRKRKTRQQLFEKLLGAYETSS